MEKKQSFRSCFLKPLFNRFNFLNWNQYGLNKRGNRFRIGVFEKTFPNDGIIVNFRSENLRFGKNERIDDFEKISRSCIINNWSFYFVSFKEFRKKFLEIIHDFVFILGSKKVLYLFSIRWKDVRSNLRVLKSLFDIWLIIIIINHVIEKSAQSIGGEIIFNHVFSILVFLGNFVFIENLLESDVFFGQEFL